MITQCRVRSWAGLVADVDDDDRITENPAGSRPAPTLRQEIGGGAHPDPLCRPDIWVSPWGYFTCYLLLVAPCYHTTAASNQ